MSEKARNGGLGESENTLTGPKIRESERENKRAQSASERKKKKRGAKEEVGCLRKVSGRTKKGGPERNKTSRGSKMAKGKGKKGPRKGRTAPKKLPLLNEKNGKERRGKAS